MPELRSERVIITVKANEYQGQRWNTLICQDASGIFELGDGGWDVSGVPQLVPCSLVANVEMSSFGKKGWKLSKSAPPLIQVLK